MTTVFLSGSRRIHRLNAAVRTRIQNIVDQGFHVLVGDAHGADHAMQSDLAEKRYPNVTITCAGRTCRNNVGGWVTQTIPVDPTLTGRAFYTQKDKVMAAQADYGLVLWDGRSTGSFNNVCELVRLGKSALVYVAPRKRFFTVRTAADAANLREHDASLPLFDTHPDAGGPNIPPMTEPDTATKASVATARLRKTDSGGPRLHPMSEMESQTRVTAGRA